MTRHLSIPPRCVMVLLLVLSAAQFASSQDALNRCRRLASSRSTLKKCEQPPAINRRELIALDRKIFAAQLKNDWAFLARQTPQYIFYEIDKSGSRVRWPSHPDAPTTSVKVIIPRLSAYTVRTYGDVAFVSSRVGSHNRGDGQAVVNGLRRVGVYLRLGRSWLFMASLMEPAPTEMKRVDAAGNLSEERDKLLRLEQEWSAKGVAPGTLNRILASDIIGNISGGLSVATSKDRRSDEEKEREENNQFQIITDREDAVQALAELLSTRKKRSVSVKDGDADNYRIDVYGDKLAVVSTEIPHSQRLGKDIEMWRTQRVHVYVKDKDWRLALLSWPDKGLPGSCVAFDPRPLKVICDEQHAIAQARLEEHRRRQKTIRAFNELQKQTRAITFRAGSLFGPQTEAANRVLTQVKADVTFLQERGKANQFNLPNEIIDVLSSEAALLKRVGLREFSPGKAFILLDATAKSLHIQRLNCEEAENGWMNVIPIDVITKKDGVEVAGYQVLLLSELDVLTGTDPIPLRISKLTPVRGEKIAPGRWFFWAEKDGQSTARQGALDTTGRDKIELEIEVR